MKNKKLNLTEDPIPYLIIKMAVPVSIGFFFHTMFNVVDIGFNSIFLKATKDLLKISKIYNLNYQDLEKKVIHTEKKLLKLYKKKQNFQPI